MVGWDSMPALDGSRASVIGSEGEREVIVILLQQRIEVRCASVDVLVGGEAVMHAKGEGGPRHELHQSACPSAADGARISTTLCFYDAGEKVHVEIVLGTGACEYLMEITGGELCGRRCGSAGRGLGRSRCSTVLISARSTSTKFSLPESRKRRTRLPSVWRWSHTRSKPFLRVTCSAA